MDPLTVEEIEDALFEGALSSLKSFLKNNLDKSFVAFAVETLTEEGYFHMCALSESDCDTKECKGALTPSFVEWNCQEWPDFDFNGSCDSWKTKCSPVEEKIEEYKRYIYGLPEEKYEELWLNYYNTFIQASKNAFLRLVKSDVFLQMKKETCFTYYIYEHHDVF